MRLCAAWSAAAQGLMRTPAVTSATVPDSRAQRAPDPSPSTASAPPARGAALSLLDLRAEPLDPGIEIRECFRLDGLRDLDLAVAARAAAGITQEDADFSLVGWAPHPAAVQARHHDEAGAFDHRVGGRAHRVGPRECIEYPAERGGCTGQLEHPQCHVRH